MTESNPQWKKIWEGGKPIIFHERRNSLEESLKTSVPLTGLWQLPLHLSALLNLRVEFKDLAIERYGYDDRIGKDLYLVRVKNVGPGGITMGFIDAEV